MVLIPLIGFNGNPGHITNPLPTAEAIPSTQRNRRSRRNTEETTPVNKFRRFSKDNSEPKGVTPMNHGLTSPSWAAGRSILGCFSVVK